MKPTNQRIDRVAAGLQQRLEQRVGPCLRVLTGERLAEFCAETGKRFASNTTEVWIWQTMKKAVVVNVLSGISFSEI